MAAIATIAVHPVHRMLKHAYWLDEAWVATLTKVPLSQLVRVEAPVPTGFVALLELAPGSGLQRGRLVVLLFSSLCVVMAYVLARSLRWESRWTAHLAAITAALVVMLAPVSLFRNDLKQYGCDAFCALLVLTVGAWADRDPARSRLSWLAFVSVVVMPFSWTAIFVVVAVFGGLLASAAIERSRSRVIDVLAVGGATGLVTVAFFAVLVIPRLNDRLHDYWTQFYFSGSPFSMLRSAWDRLSELQHALAMPAPVFVAFFALGVATLLRLKERAVAIAVVVVWFELFVAARFQKYPFLNLRTSQFLLITSLVVVAIGGVGLVLLVRRVHVVAAVVAALCLGALFTSGTTDYVHKLAIGGGDVRAQAQYVAQHREARDVIVVSFSAGFGFAYYWPNGHVTVHENDSGQGYGAEVDGLDAVYVANDSYPAIRSALDTAVARWRAAGPGSRLFIVRTHLFRSERKAWNRAFSELRLPMYKARVRVGTEAVVVLGNIDRSVTKK